MHRSFAAKKAAQDDKRFFGALAMAYERRLLPGIPGQEIPPSDEVCKRSPQRAQKLRDDALQTDTRVVVDAFVRRAQAKAKPEGKFTHLSS
jgi:hypothetical protein